jgi:hypothetical protein
VDSERVCPDPTSRLALAVAHPLVPEPETEPLDVPEQDVVPRKDELGSQLDGCAVRELTRPHAATDPFSRLEDDDLGTTLCESVGGCEPREARPDHSNAHAQPPQRSTIARARTVNAASWCVR